MTERTSFYRKLAYLGAHRRPGVSHRLAQRAGDHHERGRQARPDAERASSRPGESRRSRSGQRNHQAGHARPPRRGRQPAVGESQLLQEGRRLDEPHRHARTTGQAAAELHHVLEIPGVESNVQRLGRVRRLPRPLLLRSPRHQFLQEGEHYNTDNPQLLWDLGWFIGQKIGRADEYVQYRRLFKAR